PAASRWSLAAELSVGPTGEAALRRAVTALAVAIASASAACTGPGWLRRLPKCATSPGSADALEWPQVATGEYFYIRLPPGCVATEDADRFIHGGSSWHCGEVSVS